MDLSGNALTSLPESITQLRKLSLLNLKNNHLTTVPQFIASLEQLESLIISENPIEEPPLEVAAKGVEAISDYYAQLGQGEIGHLYEAKLILVGEAGAGKTTLASKLIDKTYEPQATTGIAIYNWTFPLNGHTFRVNMWDFGAQELYHATHELFLTKGALYVLVADTRKEDTDFYYWLNIIGLLSDNSPVLIVKNAKQDRSRDINERQLRGQFPNLKATFATNLATNRGLDEIRDQIKLRLSLLPQIGAAVPRTWARVRAVLDKASRDYINLKEYFGICQQNGFSDHENMLQLIAYLHDLGVCLHFQDDPLLRNLVILNPKWGTDAVYEVLDNNKVSNDFNKFNRRDLANIWSGPRYAAMQDELLQLMINFKLCYRIPNSESYIAPTT